MYLYGHGFNLGSENMRIENDLDNVKLNSSKKGSALKNYNEEQKELISQTKEYSKKMQRPDPSFVPKADETFLKMNYAFNDTMKKNDGG